MIIVFFLLFAISFLANIDICKASLVLGITYPTLSLFPFTPIFDLYTILTLILLLMFINRSNNGEYYVEDKFPFTFPFVICAISYAVSYIIQDGNFSFNVFFRQFSSLIVTYIIWRTYRPSDEYNHFFLNTILIYVSLMAVVGVYEAFSNIHPIYEFFRTINIELPVAGDNSHRTGFNRTQSLAIYADTYGLMLIACLASIILMYMKNYLSNFVFILFLFVIMFEVLTTNSRTAYAASIISLSILFLNMYSIRRVLSFIIFLIGFYVAFEGVIADVIELMINHENSGGSTLEMRLGQWDMTLYVVQNNLFWGIGETATNCMIDEYHDDGLFGAESIIFKTVMVRGFFGLFSLLLLWYFMIRYILINRCYPILLLFISVIFCMILTLCYSIREVYILSFLIPLVEIYKKSYLSEN